MKKYLYVVAVMVAIVGALAGCSANAVYSAEERQVIVLLLPRVQRHELS